MDKIFEEIKNCDIFKCLNSKELLEVYNELSINLKTYKKGDTIMQYGDYSKHLCILIDGAIDIIKMDFMGNENIVARLNKSSVFAEVFTLSKTSLNVDVLAAEDCNIAFINIEKALLANGEGFNKFKLNLLNILARKNLILNQKIEFLSKRSIREKIIFYLSEQSKKYASKEFKIPFDRQSLANFLSVDRSALSKELAKMKAEKIIDYRKNNFKLLK